TAAASSSNVHGVIGNDAGHVAPWFCLPCASKNKSRRCKVKHTSYYRRHLVSEHSDVYTAPSQPTVNQGKTRHYFKSEGGGSTVGGKRKVMPSADFTNVDREYSGRKLIDWIVTHFQSFTVVELDEFVEFCDSLRPECRLPSRDTVRARVLNRW
ncbi:hypothetical protein PBRA_009520, partial [Plasmodiophora brassicae]